jgi:hypothetical protein
MIRPVAGADDMRGHPENEPDWESEGYTRRSEDELEADDDSDENDGNEDGWDEDGWDEGAESLEVACPHCGADVFEDAEQCPHCGEYIVHSTSPWDGRPFWWRLLGVLGIVAVIVSLLAVLLQ